MSQSTPKAAQKSGPQKAAVWLALILGLLLALAASLAAVVTLRPDFALGQVQSLLAKSGYDLKWETLDLDPATPALKAANLTLKGPGLDLALESLGCRAPWSNLLGDGPPLEAVELKGLTLKASTSKEKSSSGGFLDWAAWLIKAGRIKAERVSAFIDLGPLTVSLTGLDLSVESQGGGDNALKLGGGLALEKKNGAGSLKGRVTATGRVRAGQALWAKVGMEGAGLSSPDVNGFVDLALELKLGADNLELGSIRAGLRRGTVSLPGGSLAVSPELIASGSIFLADGSMNWSLEKLTLPGLMEISGKASGPTWPLMAGGFQCRVLDLDRAVSLLKPLFPKEASPYSASGKAVAGLKLVGDESYELLLEPDHASVKGPGLNARVNGGVMLKGSWEKAPKLSGAVELQGRVQAGNARMESFALKLPLTGGLGLPGSSGFSLDIPPGGLSLDKKILPLGKVRLAGDAVWVDGKLVLDKLDLALDKLGRFRGDLELDPGAETRGSLEGGLDSLAELAPLAGLFGIGLEHWAPEGSAKVKAFFSHGKAGFSAKAGFTPRGLGLSSPDGVFLASGVGGEFGLDLLLPPKGAAVCKVSASVGKGELLYKAYYLNLAKSPFSLHGSVSPLEPGWQTQGLYLALGGLGGLSLKGSLAHGAGGLKPGLKLTLEVPSLEAVHRGVFKDALAESNPDLAAMRVEGGLLARLELAGGKGGGMSVRGEIALAGAVLGPGRGQPWARGLDLRLPVSYLFDKKAAPAVPAKQDWGMLSVESLSLPGLALDHLELPLALVPNRLLTGKGIALPLYGAQVELGKVEVKEPLSAGFRAVTSLDLKKLDLARLPLPVKLKGELGGRLQPVLFDARGLRASGYLRGKMFGGDLTVSRIHARPFSPGRGFGLSLEAENLDLKELTSALKAGVITGRADVSLTGFEMDYGQPVAFDLKVRSRPVGITDQMVSLEAVNSISVMGTGAGLTGLGVSVFKQIFSRFPYREIGFRCRLENDVFKVQGLIKDDGVEYLVQKPPLMGINVINQNPDNLIGFSDMVERLKRVMNDSGPKTEGDKAAKE